MRLVLATPHVLVSRAVPVKREEVERLALAFRAAVQNPARDPRPAGKRLYDLLIAPLEAELAGSKAGRIIFSLDGPLRYAPMAALWDGGRFLAERYPSGLFTRSTVDKLGLPRPEGPVLVRALGASVGRPGFPPLPGVPDELAAVVREGPSPESPPGGAPAAAGGQPGGAPGAPAEGVLEGRRYLDSEFGLDALVESLASGAPVVHIASHFRLVPASPADTALLLGDGETLSLEEIWGNVDLDFGSLDLLTLSACDTASGAARRADGAEVESFGETVQTRGAAAVIASLWKVNDASTAALMREFYRLRYVEGLGKAEALRGAQLAVMKGGGAPASSGDAAPS
jgi:CHAT domain-containing protein